MHAHVMRIRKVIELEKSINLFLSCIITRNRKHFVLCFYKNVFYFLNVTLFGSSSVDLVINDNSSKIVPCAICVANGEDNVTKLHFFEPN